MLGKLIRKAITNYTMKTGKGLAMYRRCKPTGQEYAEFLRLYGGFYSIGKGCYISADANITDPSYVRIGNNVRIGCCNIFGHDGSINMINSTYGLKLDAVGKVDILDNVFIGHGAIIQPGVTIGPNAIVGAGAVVNRTVAEGSIVIGAPAKHVGTVAMHIKFMKMRNEKFPWRKLIEERVGEYDLNTEPELLRQRIAYFFPKETGEAK